MSLAKAKTTSPLGSSADTAGCDTTLTDEVRLLAVAADVADLPHAFGRPPLSGVIRVRPEDFSVVERLPFEPQGEGEHLYLRIRKTGHNTRWVGRHLAEAAGISPRAVGWAGLKDRHAVAEQWFSLHLPGAADPDPATFESQGIEVRAARRHSRKLRVGMVAANRFEIVVRELDGERDGFAGRIAQVLASGVPNYFGAQRFGREGNNLRWFADDRADLLKRDRALRSFGLSALRSALFNGYLAGRVAGGDWLRVLPGEIGYRPGERDFSADVAGGEQSLLPTGLLWGDGINQATGEARTREDAWFATFPRARAVLEAFETRMSRRTLVAMPEDLEWSMRDDALTVRFGLGRGSFATSVLRELINIDDRGNGPAD